MQLQFIWIIIKIKKVQYEIKKIQYWVLSSKELAKLHLLRPKI